MPPRSNKRRRIESTVDPATKAESAPIIFTSPGLQPDVRLNVLGTDFHVHSLILKLHSAFFRAFLDSPDKQPLPDTAPFRYEYSSVLDKETEEDPNREEDRSLDVDVEIPVKWMLEPGRKVSRFSAGELSKADTCPKMEVESFQRLLCAMYNRPWTIQTLVQLGCLVRLADYYRSLPVVSMTLDRILCTSDFFPDLCLGIPLPGYVIAAQSLLRMAVKLRNPALFRESFIYVVARWEPALANTKITESTQLLQLVTREHIAIYSRMMSVQYHILLNPDVSDIARSVADEEYIDLVDMPTACSGEYFRKLSEVLDQEFPDSYEDVKEALADLLSNELRFRRPGERERCDEPSQYFWCAKVSDKEMPWDMDATDW